MAVKLKHFKRFQNTGLGGSGVRILSRVIYQAQLGRDKASQPLIAGATIFTTSDCVISFVHCGHQSVHLICLLGRLSIENDPEP